MAEQEGAHAASLAGQLAPSEVWGAYRSGQRHGTFQPSGVTADSMVMGLFTVGEIVHGGGGSGAAGSPSPLSACCLPNGSGVDWLFKAAAFLSKCHLAGALW